MFYIPKVLHPFRLAIFFTLIVHIGYGQSVEIDTSLFRLFTPPNTVHLYRNSYIDETEISNSHWLEYLYHVALDSGGVESQAYKNAIPDTICYADDIKNQVGIFYTSTNPTEYFSSEFYRDYPVVGVTFSQVVQYCKWRSAIVNNAIKRGAIEIPEKLKEYTVEVEYRLPTIEEWEYAASGGLDLAIYPYGQIRPMKNHKYVKRKIKSSNYCMECLQNNYLNFNPNDYIYRVEFQVVDEFYYKITDEPFYCRSDSTAFCPTIVVYYPENGYKIHNLVGNVCEMTSNEGIAKGGSFKDKLANFNVKTNFTYSKPEKWLGFRCFCVVTIRKKKIATFPVRKLSKETPQLPE